MIYSNWPIVLLVVWNFVWGIFIGFLLKGFVR